VIRWRASDGAWFRERQSAAIAALATADAARDSPLMSSPHVIDRGDRDAVTPQAGRHVHGKIAVTL
jgi:hypothetical protein